MSKNSYELGGGMWATTLSHYHIMDYEKIREEKYERARPNCP